MGNRIELQKQVNLLKKQLEDLEHQVLVEEALEKIKVDNIKNNLLEDVQLITVEQVSLDIKYYLVFKLNGVQFQTDIKITHSQSLMNDTIKIISEIIFKEITNMVTINFPDYRITKGQEG
jgi:hypothetical protein